ncbi:hypothetical protein [uncultured Litoreibacter sp.]|uniref:hypothetical protein n=1 Tax=uncultured Litoreibacter sp. TaxID=1392394 RepID=UPI00262146F7|nr:hypothetical protein [uncultured Litoreibacter sp.]
MKFTILAIAICFPLSLFAKPALVKSGEHKEFSRLVIYTGDIPKWEKTKTGDNVAISLLGWSSNFDTSSVFTFIPQTRVKKIQKTDSELLLTLGCNCSVEVSPISGVGLKIDIIDVAASSPTLRLEAPKYANWFAPNEMVSKNETSAATRHLRSALEKSIDTASNQRILDPSAISQLTDSSQSLTIRPHEPVPISQLRMRSRTTAESSEQKNDNPALIKLKCPPIRHGDIENWGTSDPFALQLADLRRELVGEFDAVHTKTAHKLARLYLHFSMGAEAISTLNSLSQHRHNDDLILPIANLLEGNMLNELKVNIPLNGCTGSNAIWAALMSAEDTEISEPQIKIILKSFALLPDQLQTVLAPRLSKRLLAEGKDVAASVLTKQASRGKEAKDLLSYNFKDVTVPQLETQISKGNIDTPPALLEYMDRNLQSGTPIDGDIKVIAESFAVQQAGDAIVPQIQSSLVRNAALEGDFTLALTLALENELLDQRGDTIPYIVSAALKNGSNFDLAKFSILLKNNIDLKTLSFDARAEVSKRLREVGLYKLSDQFILKYRSETPSQSTTSKESVPASSNRPQPPIDGSLQQARIITQESSKLRADIAETIANRVPIN